MAYEHEICDIVDMVHNDNLLFAILSTPVSNIDNRKYLDDSETIKKLSLRIKKYKNEEEMMQYILLTMKQEGYEVVKDQIDYSTWSAKFDSFMASGKNKFTFIRHEK